MKISTAILIVSLISVTPACVMGTTISQWTFESSTQAPAAVDPNATASNFTLSSNGVNYAVIYYSGNAPSPANAIGQTRWNVSNGVKWWEFTVTADPGYVLDLTSLMFDDLKSGTGPAEWSLTINGVVVVSDQPTHSTFSTDTVSLTAAAFQDISSADVKIFGYGASGYSGTWRLDNVTLDGTVTQIPSVPDSLPSNFAAAALIGILLLSRHFARCFHQSNSC